MGGITDVLKEIEQDPSARELNEIAGLLPSPIERARLFLVVGTIVSKVVSLGIQSTLTPARDIENAKALANIRNRIDGWEAYLVEQADKHGKIVV